MDSARHRRGHPHRGKRHFLAEHDGAPAEAGSRSQSAGYLESSRSGRRGALSQFFSSVDRGSECSWFWSSRFGLKFWVLGHGFLEATVTNLEPRTSNRTQNRAPSTPNPANSFRGSNYRYRLDLDHP